VSGRFEPVREPVLERFSGHSLVSSARGTIGPWTDVQRLINSEVSEQSEHEERLIIVRSGELWYRDELGSDVVVRAGEVCTIRTGFGLQFAYGGADAVVLFRGGERFTQAFYHHEWVQVMEEDGFRATVLAGEYREYRGVRTDRMDGVAIWANASATASTELFIRPNAEHAVIVLSGSVCVEGERLMEGEALYLGMDRFSIRVSAEVSSDFLLLGGVPL